ncbi:MAG TPA: LysM domain-containing protein [Desulfobacteria bacterium]|nr:LysM domain-containing protein [Desulfobacteria bacterium]
MTEKKEKDRFLFFKYVPPKKRPTPIKNDDYKKVDTVSEANTEWFDPPECPEIPYEPPCPEEPECGECPEFPDIPECPEIPDFPECPELPEIPEIPEIPECPEEEPIEEGPCPENAIMHVIQAGDTFWKLSRKYDTTVEAIAAANPELDPLNLQIGETICIPPGIPGAKG